MWGNTVKKSYWRRTGVRRAYIVAGVVLVLAAELQGRSQSLPGVFVEDRGMCSCSRPSWRWSGRSTSTGRLPIPKSDPHRCKRDARLLGRRAAHVFLTPEMTEEKPEAFST